jgi:hypothetical protein
VGLRRFFRGLNRTIIKHQDQPRMVRLRNDWVEFDPRQWNADMDATVNVGLGAGTRERDMMAMQMIVNMQTAAMAQLGPDNPLVKPYQMYNGLQKLTQAAGVKNTDAFFTKPDPQEVQQKLQQAASKPSPEQEKAQAAMQIKQAELQQQAQLEQIKMQTEASREREQRDADLIVKQKELENDQAKTAFEAQASRETELAKIAATSQAQLERELIILERTQSFEREKMAHAERMATAKMANDNTMSQMKAQSSDNSGATP